MAYKTRLLDVLKRVNEGNATYPKEPRTLLDVLRLVNLRNEVRQGCRYLTRKKGCRIKDLKDENFDIN